MYSSVNVMVGNIIDIISLSSQSTSHREINYPNFTDEETETQEDEVSHWNSHSCQEIPVGPQVSLSADPVHVCFSVLWGA